MTTRTFAIGLLAALVVGPAALAQPSGVPHAATFDLQDVPGFLEYSRPPSASADTVDAPGAPLLTPSEERDFSRRVRAMNDAWERSVSLPAYASAMETVGLGRQRDLQVANFEYNLHENYLNGYQIEDDFGAEDPDAFDEAADAVLSSYLKLQREALESYLGLDQFLDRGDGGAPYDGEPSYKLRFSPQVGIGGSNDYVAVKVRMPYTRSHFLDHFALRVKQRVDSGETVFDVKFDDGPRHAFLEFIPDSVGLGDRMSLNVRMWF